MIRRYLIAVGFITALGTSQAAFAQAGDAGAAAPVALDAATSAAGDAGAAAAPAADAPKAPEEGSNEDLIAKLKEAKNAYDELKEAKDSGDSPLKFAWAGLIAAIASLLLSGVKRAMKLTGKAKKILPWVAVGLGAVVVGATHFAGGMGLTSALFYGGAVLGSVVLQELGINPIKSLPEKKSA